MYKAWLEITVKRYMYQMWNKWKELSSNVGLLTQVFCSTLTPTVSALPNMVFIGAHLCISQLKPNDLDCSLISQNETVGFCRRAVFYFVRWVKWPIHAENFICRSFLKLWSTGSTKGIILTVTFYGKCCYAFMNLARCFALKIPFHNWGASLLWFVYFLFIHIYANVRWSVPLCSQAIYGSPNECGRTYKKHFVVVPKLSNAQKLLMEFKIFILWDKQTGTFSVLSGTHNVSLCRVHRFRSYWKLQRARPLLTLKWISNMHPTFALN